VEPVDRESFPQRRCGHAAYVAGLAGAFQAVQQHDFTGGFPRGPLRF
jgi:hypothetical protein